MCPIIFLILLYPFVNPFIKAYRSSIHIFNSYLSIAIMIKHHPASLLHKNHIRCVYIYSKQVIEYLLKFRFHSLGCDISANSFPLHRACLSLSRSSHGTVSWYSFAFLVINILKFINKHKWWIVVCLSVLPCLCDKVIIQYSLSNRCLLISFEFNCYHNARSSSKLSHFILMSIV